MIFKLLSKQQYNFLTCTTNRIFKCNLCNAVSAQTLSKNYKYLLILDFEATCDKPRTTIQEIIEFPCLKFNINSLSEEGRFHHYVRPVIRPTLSHFCTELTGILQEMVDEANTFPEVFKMFQDWRLAEDLTEENSLYITSGDWDLGHMLPQQCSLTDLEVPSHMRVWSDIKKVFGFHANKFCNNFLDIMVHYNLQFEGRKHSGIDDCLNMLRVIKKMSESGVTFKPTSIVSSSKVETINSRLKEEVNKLSGPSLVRAKHFKKR